MANIAEIKASLSQIAEEASTAAATLRATAEEAGRSVQRLRTSLGGASHPRALQGLANAEQHLAEAAELAERGAAAVRAYAEVLG